MTFLVLSCAERRDGVNPVKISLETDGVFLTYFRVHCVTHPRRQLRDTCQVSGRCLMRVKVRCGEREGGRRKV